MYFLSGSATSCRSSNVFATLQIDEVINQAQATRSVLGSQRALFGDVGGKVKVLSEKFPVIRGLLGTNTLFFILFCLVRAKLILLQTYQKEKNID